MTRLAVSDLHSGNALPIYIKTSQLKITFRLLEIITKVWASSELQVWLMSNLDDGDQVTSRFADQGCNIRRRGVALISMLHYAFLHVNDKQGGFWPVCERRHLICIELLRTDLRYQSSVSLRALAI